MVRRRDDDEIYLLQNKPYKVKSFISGKGGTGYSRRALVPRIILFPNIILENSPVDTVVGTVGVLGVTGTPSYTLVNNAGGRFKLVGNSLQVAAATIDYETATSHSIIIGVTGVTPVIANSPFTIFVTDVAATTPPAPTLLLTTPPTDTTPDFTLTGDLVLGDTVRFQYSAASDFTGATELTNAIDAGEDAANSITFTTGVLSPITWYFRARIERAEAPASGWSNTETVTIVGATYAGGPGNIVPGARSWVGLRAYNTAYATGSNPALDLHNDATGAFVATINILDTGALDVATAATVIAGGASRIGKLYDQTGNGNHLTQPTNANRPTLTLSGLGSLPVMTFNGTNSHIRNTTTFENAPGATISAVANGVSNGAQQSLCLAGQQIGYNNSGANTVFLYAGGVLTAPATDGAWHAIQGVFGTTTSNSILNVDNVSTTGNAGTDITGVASVNLGATDIGSQAFLGKIAEAGYWATTAFSGANCTAVNANQHAYWGF
jgi:hypothetical protein